MKLYCGPSDILLWVPLFWLYPLESLVKLPLNLQGGKHIFSPTFFLILPDVILLMFMNKKIGKCHQATFIALPVT